MFLNIANYFKTLRCSCGAVAFIFFNLLKTSTVYWSRLRYCLARRPYKQTEYNTESCSWSCAAYWAPACLKPVLFSTHQICRYNFFRMHSKHIDFVAYIAYKSVWLKDESSWSYVSCSRTFWTHLVHVYEFIIFPDIWDSLFLKKKRIERPDIFKTKATLEY